ncbi:Glycerol-3-phosphate cytidylyltransferase [Staphylothermus marinus F1]|uniref:Glycerol-3-phosphate cytidylyltransferase n=1 Tax=Staphylothermus marinus (strain ATCC 43588 / DSM 3639 / JCM 9404 / F1) TaxID=399550 RepID=A3DL06_STAMF|nr:Glycerol-3-phosphate cytidylyltransferase [Staphylothermus marinus F1]
MIMKIQLRNRVDAYILNVEKALNQIDKSKLGDKEKKLIEIAEAYLSDAKYYFDKKDYETSLACVAYAEGLIDSLRYLGKINIFWEPLSKLLNRPKVLVAGGFEIIHPGHIYLFKKAWEKGRVYVVVARDKNFKKFKKREPVIPENQRLKVVENIKYVYKAVLGDEHDYLKPVENIKPDIILLGPDQWPQEEKLKKELEARGLSSVKVERLDKRIDENLYSVSRIIRKIVETHKCGQ